MQPKHDMLERQLENYENELKQLTSYITELNGQAAQHGTQKEIFAEELSEAENNVIYYTGEIARLKSLLAEEPDGVKYLVFKDSAGEWCWQLRAGNNRAIADSGEGYRNKQDCLHAIALVKDSKNAPVKEK